MATAVGPQTLLAVAQGEVGGQHELILRNQWRLTDPGVPAVEGHQAELHARRVRVEDAVRALAERRVGRRDERRARRARSLARAVPWLVVRQEVAEVVGHAVLAGPQQRLAREVVERAG